MLCSKLSELFCGSNLEHKGAIEVSMIWSINLLNLCMQGSQRPAVVLEWGYSDPAIYSMLRIP